MKNIKTILTKSEILEEVSLKTEYTGAKAEAPEGFYDRVATVSADNALLSTFWKEMAGKLMETFRPFVDSMDIGEDSLQISLNVSNGYDESLTPSLENDIRSAFVAGITAGWFRFTSPDKHSEWSEASTRFLSSALSLLCHRRPPRRQ